jgi:aspartokinase/homoserine dehydrogenase 1
VIGHKFGGSSVANADCIRRVVDILVGRDEAQVVVISAMKGVTDALIGLVKAAAAADHTWKTKADALERQHLEAATALLGAAAAPAHERLRAEFADLRELLRAQQQVGAVSTDLLDLISGLGEVWSSELVHRTLEARGAASRWLDARDVLVVHKTELGAHVDWERTREKLARVVGTPGPRTIVTGFVARTGDGRITTLGRNGSDYSGAIFAALFDAKELHVWSDVDGVLSADPRLVPEAVLIKQLSYSEACELAYFGAKVIHPQTMAPAFERNIPIIARNTFNPSHGGTRISSEHDVHQPVKGVTAFSGLAVLTIEGAGMIGVPGTAERAFQALKEAGVSVVMISQGSSEHSICCVVRETDAAAGRRAVREAFTLELDRRQISDVTITPGVAALAVVGDGMAGMPGVAGRLFSALGRANINVRMIAQGASERNISVAIDAAQVRRALRAVHASFYLAAQTISVGVIGPGNVGQAFLRQLDAARARLLETHGIDLRVRAVMSSRRMALGDPSLQLEGIAARLDRDADFELFTAHVQADHLPHAVIVDCSASDAVAERYLGWLARGIHVITPNKHAGSGPMARYEKLKAQRARFLYESTVGAGLPVITTLRDLLDTGDEVLAIEGIFSGTLAYLFNVYDGSKPFSALVREAKALGYTEPDPRDDLSGMDVARKLVILARETGWKLELEQLSLESLVPAALRDVPVEEFLRRLEELDAPMQAKLERARREGRVLRYVAKLATGGAASVGLAALPADHAFAHIRLTDNVVQFTTQRYRANPLVVQGPGAGPEVTAAGVFADLLRVAASLGARP